MIKAFLDTNVVLNIALARPLFYEEASEVFLKINENKMRGYISATSVTDIFYVLYKAKTDASGYLKKLLKIVDVLEVDKHTIITALYSGWTDFEDAVQLQVAIENEMDVIITRNTKDFQKTKKIRVLTPKEFIASGE
ncbi:MAG: PIN domain-containing protein [Candidatus Azobacteroides sp.]|nr:PIN domain-containing protein [Candidatus Azobacteroides sp.]